MEKTHLSPFHWQRGTEEFHEDNSKLSVLPCNEALIFPKRSSTSGDEEEEAEEEDNDSVSVVDKPLVKTKKKKM